MTKVITYTTPDSDIAKVVFPTPTCKYTIEELAQKTVPQGIPYQIMNHADLPKDSFFRNAWRETQGAIDVPMDIGREVAHERRRVKREFELSEYDQIVAKQIPGKVEAAEAQRQVIRDKYTVVQTNIDNATTLAEMKQIVEGA